MQGGRSGSVVAMASCAVRRNMCAILLMRDGFFEMR